MKAKTGLQHLTVINQSHQQYLQKTCRIYMSISLPSVKVMRRITWRMMEQEGISRYLVSVGSALNSRGMNGAGQPWRVAIQKPTESKENAVQAVVDINGHGDAHLWQLRNYYELDGKRLSHVIDPQTGRPIEHNLVSVTVIAPTALVADAGILA